MKLIIYNFLVNTHPGIRDRYHAFHDQAYGIRRYLSWLYLLALNFGYYVLHLRFLDEKRGVAVYEEKELLTEKPESEKAAEGIPSVESYINTIKQYDIISFDIFDTLIFRPFSEPTDLFFFLGEKLSFMDFKRIRMELEQRARQENFRERGHYEVTLKQIWGMLEQETGLSAELGMELEQALELQFCYANPFMKAVYDALVSLGKKIIIVSDMYLPSECLERILQAQGYTGYHKLFVSCEYGRNKASGDLYEMVKKELEAEKPVIHVGDNPVSDQQMAQRAGWAIMPYVNVNKSAKDFRTYDMSPLIGGAYRGLIQNHIWCGLKSFSMEYEYGYIYGGLFVTGYCQFIRRYAKENKVDKILFLSRDGDILKQAYDRLFPEECTEYVYWSRRAATKLLAVCDKYDYVRRFVYHKVNQGYTVRQVLVSMELLEEVHGTSKLTAVQSSKNKQAWDSHVAVLAEELEKVIGLEAQLTDKNASDLVSVLQQHWNKVLKIYEPQHQAAKQYYSEVLKGCRKACAVDIGWAGSGAMALRKLVREYWEIPCEITGLIAGTNTVHNAEPFASESFLQSGKLRAYLFSQAHNRDLMKKHDLNCDYNVYWELLLSSPTRQFIGFALDDSGQVDFQFGKYDKNTAGMQQIQQGILDFVSDYQRHFGEIPWMLDISGRDSYAPMLLAAGKKEKYLKVIKKLFSLEVNVE